MQLIFGPVNSRRFGRSLGVDLSPQTKQCNFDCLYCELSPAQPVEKQTYTIAPETILKELKEHLRDDIDVITITANGEPTLYPFLDQLIEGIDKIKKSMKTLILTNSAMLTNENIFTTLLTIDKVKLSLDAVSQDVFQKIDRPVKSVDIKKIVEALQKFSQEFQGEIYIEILFVKGLNDTPAEVKALNEVLTTLENITRIDLGTIDRPPAYPVEAVSFEELHVIAQMFESSLPVHIVKRVKEGEHVRGTYMEDEIVNTLDKRPLTYDDMLVLFDEPSLERLEKLVKTDRVVKKQVGSLVFYLPAENFSRKRVKNS